MSTQNPLRLESAAEASLVDERVLAIWSRHPHRFMVEPASDFLLKAKRVLDILRSQLPACCRHHEVPDVDDVGSRHERRINGL